MSGFHTHMLIGAVGGLAAFKVIDHVAPSAIHFPLTVSGHPYVVPPLVVGLGAMLCSAYLALWPDIDEPFTHVSNQARHYMWVAGGLVGALTILTLNHGLVHVLLGALVGVVIGLVAAMPILAALRFLSGGHRHLTHSLVVSGVLFGGGAVAATAGLWPVALPAIALAWGQVLHLAGDIETRGGVPLLYPFSRYDYHLFPYELSRYGEPIAAVAALALGGLLTLWR